MRVFLLLLLFLLCAHPANPAHTHTPGLIFSFLATAINPPPLPPSPSRTQHRHVHIALDTIVLYSALGVTTSPGSGRDPVAKNSDPTGMPGGVSPYHSGSFHQNQRNLHAPAHGPKPTLCVTSSGRRCGGGPQAVTSVISPEYGREEPI